MEVHGVAAPAVDSGLGLAQQPEDFSDMPRDLRLQFQPIDYIEDLFQCPMVMVVVMVVLMFMAMSVAFLFPMHAHREMPCGDSAAPDVLQREHDFWNPDGVQFRHHALAVVEQV